MHKTLVDISPVFPCLTVHDLHGYLLEVLLILILCDFSFNFLPVNVFLQSQQDLIRIDWLDEIISYLLADSLFHDILLFTLRDHDNRESWLQFF